jgi:hypothetical protein
MSQNVPECPTPEKTQSAPADVEPSTHGSPPADPPTPPPHDHSPGSPPQASASDSTLAPEDPLPDRQQRAIDLIVAGFPESHVAQVLGVSRRTLYRWRTDDPGYAAHLDRRRNECLQAASDRFRALLDTALDLVERHIKDPYAPTALRAARTLLNIAHINRATDLRTLGQPAPGDPKPNTAATAAAVTPAIDRPGGAPNDH